MLGVDRLDMIKGIPQKLLAFEKFLEENPDWINKVGRVQGQSATSCTRLAFRVYLVGLRVCVYARICALLSNSRLLRLGLS